MDIIGLLEWAMLQCADVDWSGLGLSEVDYAGVDYCGLFLRGTK